MEKWLLVYKSSNISEMHQDRTKVTTEDQQEVSHALSIDAKAKMKDDPEGSVCTLFQNVCHGVVIYLFLVSHSICF